MYYLIFLALCAAALFGFPFLQERQRRPEITHDDQELAGRQGAQADHLIDREDAAAIAAVSVTRINSRAKLRSGIGDIIRGSLSLQGILTVRQSWDSHDRHEKPDQLWFLPH